MDTNSPENAINPNDSEATYRALRDSILQIYQFGTKIAKEANPDNELQVSWELGDTSLMNWISDTHCYLSSKGQKLQFLARPSKLEIISFNLKEGDKLLICSDSLRQNLSDNEIDEILQESHGSENSCQNLLKIANVNYGATENAHNIVVMEVINSQRVITPPPLDDKKIKKENSGINPLWIILPILLLLLGGGLTWIWKNNLLNFRNTLTGNKPNIVVEDTLNFINKDTLILVTDKDIITKEFESEKTTAISPVQKGDFANTPIKELKSDIHSSNSNVSDNSFAEINPSKTKSTQKLSEGDRGAKISRNNTFDLVAEEENYTVLMQQKERWTIIKNDLQNILDSGNTAAADKLKNSKNVLQRIENKLQKSARKLGKN